MKPGDNVVVVYDGLLPGNTVAPPIKVGDLAVIKKTHICKCGELHVDLGIASKYNYVTCYLCKEDLPQSDSVHWCHSGRVKLT